jgi:hypothetical protein
MTGSRALFSPSIYWVWNPTRPSSPPHTGLPTLYRVPFYGGIPEVVTLHATLCEQMSIVDVVLYCLTVGGEFYRYSLDRPNSAFQLMAFNVSAPVGFVASREHVLFALSATDGLLYRSDLAFGGGGVALPSGWNSPWAPTLFNPPTNTIAFALGYFLFHFF